MRHDLLLFAFCAARTHISSRYLHGCAALTFAWALFFFPFPATASDPLLRNPFARAVAASAEPAKPYACASAPAPVRDIIANRYYTDSSSSVIDPELRRQNELAVKPIDDYLREFSRMTDLYLRTGAPAVAACALDWLVEWAKADAMLGKMSSNQADYHRKWTLAGLALNYLKIREQPSLDIGRRQLAEVWLRKLGYAVRPFFDTGRHARNNHLYWVGLAVAAAGVASDDRVLFEWATAVYREGIRQITVEGTLPLEMARRSRAVHYHNFALAPLVLIAEIGEANGLPLYAEGEGALHRLVARTVSGMVDPAYFDRAARDKQGPPPRGGELAWTVPYFKRFPAASVAGAWKEQMAGSKPTAYPRLGGDLTLLYP